MNVLLVNPWITDFAAYDFWAKPLGLLYMAAFLTRRGHTVRLVDCMDRFQDGRGRFVTGENRRHNTGKFPSSVIDTPACLKAVPRHFRRYGIPTDLFDELAKDGPRPDVVAVTSHMTYWYPGVVEAIDRLRTLFPGVPVALGGVYASLCPGHARDTTGADVVVTSPQPSEIIRSIESIGGSEGDRAMPSDDFGSWPEPAWRLYDTLPAALVMTSRGCPMDCTVCASKLLTPGYERRDPEEAARAMLVLSSRGVEDCAFLDDALLIDPERYARPLFAYLARAGSPLRLHSPNGLHVRQITADMAQLLHQAGMVTVRLSLETADESRADDFSSKTSRAEFRAAVRHLFAAGYTSREVGAYILVGLPGQAVDEVMDTVRFVIDCGVRVKPALFSPVPGTVAFNRAVAAGMLPPDADPLLHNNTLRAVDLWNTDHRSYREFMKFLDTAHGSLTGGTTA